MYNKRAARQSHMRGFKLDLKRNYDLYLMVLPAVVVIFIFNYIPMYGIQIAFKNFKPITGIWDSAWVGLKWFNRFFNTSYFETLFANTLLLSLYSLVAAFPIPIILALLLNQFRSEKVKRTLQTVSYAPHFISTVVMVGMLTIFLSPSNGLYGHLARALGYEPDNLLGMAGAFRSIYVWSDVWQHTGWDSIIYIAALSAIDPQLYEARDARRRHAAAEDMVSGNPHAHGYGQHPADYACRQSDDGRI